MTQTLDDAVNRRVLELMRPVMPGQVNNEQDDYQ
jgi:hypothetical protein